MAKIVKMHKHLNVINKPRLKENMKLSESALMVSHICKGSIEEVQEVCQRSTAKRIHGAQCYGCYDAKV